MIPLDDLIGCFSFVRENSIKSFVLLNFGGKLQHMNGEERIKMKAKSQKIGALEKVSFFLANVGNIPLMSLLSSFFTLFYNTIVGLDPAALGTLFLISKVADGISDPIMG